MSEFSDRPFVAGSLVGLRAFSVDKLGRLTGPAYGGIFKPGENTAECLKRDDFYGFPASITAALNRSMRQAMWSIDPATPRSMTVSSTPRGYGKSATIRAAQQETAELIEKKSLAQEAVEREEPPAPPPHSLAGVGCTCGYYAYFDGRNTYDETGRITAIIEGYGVCTVGSAGFRASNARLLALVEPDVQTPELLIRRNYPDVPWFTDVADALEKFPLTTDHLPSPDEDDFWTRSIR